MRYAIAASRTSSLARAGRFLLLSTRDYDLDPLDTQPLEMSAIEGEDSLRTALPGTGYDQAVVACPTSDGLQPEALDQVPPLLTIETDEN